MIEKLKKFFAPEEASDKPVDNHALTVAATALMVQLARVDNNQDDAELQTIVDCAVKSQEVTREEAEDILQDALDHADDATSLYEFTGLINEHLDQAQKQSLLESIWRVAFADGRIDKYEAHLIRRMSDLLHLNHREYIEARLRAEGDG